MLDGLNQKELCVLQSMLYEATEAAYGIVRLEERDREWFGRYRALHTELGQLFIEAALLLISRMDRAPQARPAVVQAA